MELHALRAECSTLPEQPERKMSHSSKYAGRRCTGDGRDTPFNVTETVTETVTCGLSYNSTCHLLVTGALRALKSSHSPTRRFSVIQALSHSLT